MNLIIVGTNCYDLGKEIWTANTEYAVVESNNINDKHYKAYIKDKKTITIADAEQFKDKEVNVVLDMFIKNQQIPIFVASDNASFERLMYTNISPIILESLLICGQPEKKEYDEIIQTAKGYLYGKGMVDKVDKTVSTPRRRRKVTTTK